MSGKRHFGLTTDGPDGHGSGVLEMMCFSSLLAGALGTRREPRPPLELSVELPRDEAPEVFHGTPLEDGNDFIIRPCKVSFTVLGLPADHPDVLRPAELGGLLDPRHGVGGASPASQNNNDTALAQSECHDVIPCHGAIFLPHRFPINKSLLHQPLSKGEPPGHDVKSPRPK